ncbi:hypothetical protein BCR44DRAFT_1433421 [Catenaria anguillulae PL171]|uniref:Uncharacterized protein n=1 Tax=Catenaria anguillulae PL171 TaxID=765915 RepID=A0A1Y2HQK2_9FUNG|nr:hypothetical protein BCR44DRAFT_1433421 [Catenaria anguillulae PL171]
MRPRGTSSHPPPRGYSRERGGYDGPGYHGGHDDHGARGSIGPRDRDRAPSVDRRAGPGPNLSLPPTPAAHHHPTPPRPAPGPLPVAHGPESISGLLDKYGVQPPASGGSAGAGMARDMSRSSTGGGYPSHGTGQRSRMSSAGDSRPLSASRPGSASHPSLPSKPPMPPLPLPPSAGGAGGSGPASARTSADRVAVGPPRNIGLPRAPSVTMTTSVSSGEGVWGGIGTANVGGSSEREREMPSSASVPVAEAPLANAPDRSHRDRPNPWASAVGVGANARRG